MAALDLYDQYFVFIDGKLLVENTQVNSELQGDDQDVFTIAKGFAGITPSPVKVFISLENVVPSTGFEIDVFDLFIKKKQITIRVQSGSTGKSLTSTGFIRAPKTGSGVGQTSTLSFEFHGGPGVFQ